MDHDKCFLPGGYFDESGQLHKEVELVPLSGREEELLVNTADRGAAIQVSTILGRCVKRIGHFDEVTEEIVRNLLVGDRQYLMLKLREITFGERVQATVTCPWPDCGGGVDISFNISDIPIKDASLTSPIHEFKLSAIAEGDPHIIWFRLPNGADQEALSGQLIQNQAVATTQLLWRCIQRIDDIEGPDIEYVRSLPTHTRVQIEQRMQALGPDVELTMEAVCPECDRSFSIPFDLQEFFFDELKTSRELLLREIHYLAFHYHWGEQEIMSMTRDKRQQYIDILAEEIDRMNSGVQNSAAR